VFVLPPLRDAGRTFGCVLAKFAARAGRFAALAGALVLALGVRCPVTEMIWLHPYEYTNFKLRNLAGGCL